MTTDHPDPTSKIDNLVRSGVFTMSDSENARIVNDPVNHPHHYNAHPSGIECIQVTEHMNFCRGNAMKYLWRAGTKGDVKQEVEDLRKAIWYLEREIQRLTT